jgi:hypothetical protein
MFLKYESANDLIKLGESIFYSIEIYAVVEKSKTGLCFQIFISITLCYSITIVSLLLSKKTLVLYRTE